MHLSQPKRQLINKTSYLGLSGHVFLLCPSFPQVPHFGKALIRGCKGGEGRLGRGAGAIEASIGASINSTASTKIPPSWGICLLDRVRFCFCFKFKSCNSLTSFSRIAADCMPIWHALRIWFIAVLSGLGGLLDPLRSNALIDEDCFCSCM